MSKDNAISIMTNSNLVDKSGVLYIFFCCYYFFIIYKMSECNPVKNTNLTYYQKTKMWYEVKQKIITKNIQSN